ncbi:MAG: vacuolar iron transporter family protein [Actinomycetota bacterium]|nr:vacuolar iron transporter family protein [Actinomycetota bacterium]
MTTADFRHQGEFHDHGDLGERSNKIRAAVLGANDGIVSIAGMVIGVAGANASTTAIATAGVAGLVAGALSMAVGEYVSVSSQRDTERAAVALETKELAEDPDGELRELAGLFEARGLSTATAMTVALELTERDALAAHSREELGIEPGQYVNPWAAAVSSCVSFTIGAALPLIAILTAPAEIRLWVTALAVAIALFITGFLSARLVSAPLGRAILRNVGGGLLAMAVTYGIGHLLGAAI